MTLEELNTNLFPFARLLGITVTSADPECIEAEMPVRPDMRTAGEYAHGGSLMAFADTLGGVGTFVNLPEGATGTTTIESKTNFLRAGPVNTVLKAKAIPLHRGRMTQVWQTTITTDTDKPVAIVTQTQMVLR